LALRHFIARASRMSFSPRPDTSSTLAPQRRTSGSVHVWSCSFTNSPRFPTWRLRLVSISIPIPSAVDGNDRPEVSSPSRTILAEVASRSFPPLCTRVTGRGADRSVRPDSQLRREDPHSGPHPLSRDPRAGPRSAAASRGRIRAWRGVAISGGLGQWSWVSARPRRASSRSGDWLSM